MLVTVEWGICCAISVLSMVDVWLQFVFGHFHPWIYHMNTLPFIDPDAHPCSMSVLQLLSSSLQLSNLELAGCCPHTIANNKNAKTNEKILQCGNMRY